MSKSSKKKIKFLHFVIIILLALLLSIGLGLIIPSFVAEDRSILINGQAIIKKNRYNELNKHAIENQIVFLGDSIIEYYNTDKHFSDQIIYNRGIAGNRTIDIKERINENVLSINPSKIVLHIGTNDIGAKLNHDIILNNLIDIIQLIRDRDDEIEIIINSVLPINDSNRFFYNIIYGSRKNSDIIKLNNKYQQIAELYNCVYIDLFSLLIDDEGKLDLSYTFDGLHLNDRGYSIITQEIIKYL